MKLNELKKILKNVVTSPEHIPIMVWSSPGLGKSSVVRQVAEELNMGFIDLRLSLLNPVDLRGLPSIDRENNTSKWLSPEFLPSEKKHGKSGILFLDEINLAPFSVMAAGYQLILDRKLGEYQLPPGWAVIAAGNRTEDNGNVTKFPSPLANRFAHIEIECDEKVWRDWAISQGVSEEIISFLGKFPQHLCKFPKAGEKTFPTPRSWELASKLYSIGEDIGISVGEGVASEFKAFLRVYQKLPDVEQVLLGKYTKVPEDIDVLWALSTAIIVRSTPSHVPTIVKYSSGMPKEFEVLTILGLANKGPAMEVALINSKEWKDWTDTNRDLIDNSA